MSMVLAFSRLCLQASASTAGPLIAAPALRSISTGARLQFQLTPVVWAEPLKKKKRLDPQIIKAREERRRKKLEKQIKRLEKNARQLKPIDELEVPLVLIDERDKRIRTGLEITPEIAEKRALLEKTWARYKMQQKLAQYQKIDTLILAQETALNELRYESEELYQEAIQPDFRLLPFIGQGPVATPPIDNYESPDGDYVDISKKWE